MDARHSELIPDPSSIRLRRLLGRGAHASVHHATGPIKSQQWAIKLHLPGERACKDTTAERNFVEEAELMEELRCAHVVSCYGLLHLNPTTCQAIPSSPSDGALIPAMLLEYMEAGSMARLVLNQMSNPGRKCYTDYEALHLLLDVALGLHCLHSQPVIIVHRDLKMENLLLTRKHGRLQAKIADLGLHAKLQRNAVPALLRRKMTSSSEGGAAPQPAIFTSADPSMLANAQDTCYSLPPMAEIQAAAQQLQQQHGLEVSVVETAGVLLPQPQLNMQASAAAAAAGQPMQELRRVEPSSLQQQQQVEQDQMQTQLLGPHQQQHLHDDIEHQQQQQQQQHRHADMRHQQQQHWLPGRLGHMLEQGATAPLVSEEQQAVVDQGPASLMLWGTEPCTAVPACTAPSVGTAASTCSAASMCTAASTSASADAMVSAVSMCTAADAVAAATSASGSLESTVMHSLTYTAACEVSNAPSASGYLEDVTPLLPEAGKTTPATFNTSSPTARVRSVLVDLATAAAGASGCHLVERSEVHSQPQITQATGLCSGHALRSLSMVPLSRHCQKTESSRCMKHTDYLNSITGLAADQLQNHEATDKQAMAVQYNHSTAPLAMTQLETAADTEAAMPACPPSCSSIPIPSPSPIHHHSPHSSQPAQQPPIGVPIAPIAPAATPSLHEPSAQCTQPQPISSCNPPATGPTHSLAASPNTDSTLQYKSSSHISSHISPSPFMLAAHTVRSPTRELSRTLSPPTRQSHLLGLMMGGSIPLHSFGPPTPHAGLLQATHSDRQRHARVFPHSFQPLVSTPGLLRATNSERHARVPPVGCQPSSPTYAPAFRAPGQLLRATHSDRHDCAEAHGASTKTQYGHGQGVLRKVASHMGLLTLALKTSSHSSSTPREQQQSARRLLRLHTTSAGGLVGSPLSSTAGRGSASNLLYSTANSKEDGGGCTTVMEDDLAPLLGSAHYSSTSPAAALNSSTMQVSTTPTSAMKSSLQPAGTLPIVSMSTSAPGALHATGPGQLVQVGGLHAALPSSTTGTLGECLEVQGPVGHQTSDISAAPGDADLTLETSDLSFTWFVAPPDVRMVSERTADHTAPIPTVGLENRQQGANDGEHPKQRRASVVLYDEGEGAESPLPFPSVFASTAPANTAQPTLTTSNDGAHQGTNLGAVGEMQTVDGEEGEKLPVQGSSPATGSQQVHSLPSSPQLTAAASTLAAGRKLVSALSRKLRNTWPRYRPENQQHDEGTTEVMYRAVTTPGQASDAADTLDMSGRVQAVDGVHAANVSSSRPRAGTGSDAVVQLGRIQQAAGLKQDTIAPMLHEIAIQHADIHMSRSHQPGVTAQLPHSASLKKRASSKIQHSVSAGIRRIQSMRSHNSQREGQEPADMTVMSYARPRKLPKEFQRVYNLTSETGSCMYMAPEVYRGEPYNESVDVFSLGVVMYELLARSMLVFTHVGLGRAANSSEEYAEIVSKGFRPERPHAMTDEVWTLINACWAQDPLDRPRIKYVVQDLMRLLETSREEMEAQHSQRCNKCCVIS